MKLLFLLLQITKMFSIFYSVSRIVLIFIDLAAAYVRRCIVWKTTILKFSKSRRTRLLTAGDL